MKGTDGHFLVTAIPLLQQSPRRRKCNSSADRKKQWGFHFQTDVTIFLPRSKAAWFVHVLFMAFWNGPSPFLVPALGAQVMPGVCVLPDVAGFRHSGCALCSEREVHRAVYFCFQVVSEPGSFIQYRVLLSSWFCRLKGKVLPLAQLLWRTRDR